MTDPMLKQIAALVERSQRILIITGAGVSADSGLPTYRGIGGLYNDTTTDEGVTIEEALSGSMFQCRPEITWKHIARIGNACFTSQPNRAHEVIALLEGEREVCVLTQNVDGFHRQAGSTNLIEIHGDIADLYCPKCAYRRRVSTFDGLEIPPHCPGNSCDAVIRPDVVLFEEMLPGHKIEALQDQLTLGFDIVFSIGTTSVFPYIAAPVVHASDHGIPTVEINPADTGITDLVDFKVRRGAADAMDSIWAALQ